MGDIRAFAKRNAVPIIEFKNGQRKEQVARQHIARFNQPEGVVMIGVAQEKVSGFRCYLKGGNDFRADGVLARDRRSTMVCSTRSSAASASSNRSPVPIRAYRPPW